MNLAYYLHQEEIFRIIRDCSKQIKQDSYIVGGYVRDLLLGKIKSEDFDILTIGESIRLVETISEEIFHFRKCYPKVKIFKRYGTAMIEYHNKRIEIVNSRKESYHYSSRNPMIHSGSLQDDQNRRDFTINALAISLNYKNYGDLIDPFNGLLDIKKKILKTPLNSDITFSDDPLRMIRAIRFSTQLRFSIEKNSFKSIRKNRHRIHILSQERITEEINKILLTNQPSIGLYLLYQTGLLSLILPELISLKGVEERNGFIHKDNFDHTLQVVDNISMDKNNSLWLRWSALLHDIGKTYTKKFSSKIGWSFHSHELVGSQMISNIFERLKLPKGRSMNYVIKIVKNSFRPMTLVQENISDSAIRRLLFDVGDDIDDLIKLCIADITTHNLEKKIKYKKNFLFLMKKIKKIEKKDRMINWKSPITGNDIMKVFDVNPSQIIGIIKDYIKDSILEGKIPNEYHSAYLLMLKKGKELGLTRNKKF
ncbi:CCA tRNA nucleotidyltransferase [Blattabacterium cuenoti]|uniref:CCA tRNA nucleotidyltransferase n=1 Tax=Blattabacterium cuenoti TaxID=1653831 RepID=UPI00163C5020|nr:HD domain-containing protein [Blattabacterium cuenoti]